MTPAIPQDHLGVRPMPGGVVRLDSTAIASAIRSSGRYDYRFVGQPSAARVVLEVFRRDEGRPGLWCSRCLACGSNDVHLDRLPIPCCGAWRRSTRIPAGWSWSGDVDWPMARAVAEGAHEDDPDQLWRRYPAMCLFARAIREAWKLHAPDALPVGLIEVHTPEEGRKPAAPARPGPARPAPADPARVSVVEAKRRRDAEAAAAPQPKKLTKRQAEATMGLARAQLGDACPPAFDEHAERLALELAEAARIDAEAQSDPRPAVADPDWFADEDKGTEGAAEVSRAPAHAAGTSPAAASTTLPAGNTDAPRLAEPAPSSEVVGLPAGGAAGLETVDTRLSIPPDACWTCDRAPCVCPADATTESKTLSKTACDARAEA